MPASRPPSLTSRRDALALALVLAAAVAGAGALWARGEDLARARWTLVEHDRNHHYATAIELALHAREGDPVGFAGALDRARQWPPLHALLAATTLGLGGIDPRIAWLPSLGAWVAFVGLAFAAARRAAPLDGRFAGAVAALLAIGSPAHHAYASDVMLESLGAALTLFAVWAHATAQHSERPAAWRRLAVALTLLFFTKYSYWLLVVLALAAAQLVLHAETVRAALRPAAGSLRAHAPAWAARQARRPLVWLVALALAAAPVVPRFGGWEGTLLGVPVEIRGAGEPLHVAWIALTLAVLPWWRRSGRAALAALDPRWRSLLLWHGLPLGVYFLLPARLGKVFAHVGPGNTQMGWDGPIAGLRRYAGWIATDDFAAPAVALLAALLALAALPALLRRVPGAVTAASLLGVGAALALLHPNQQPRYAHTWIPGLWLLAGAGAAEILRRSTRHHARVRAAAAPLALALLALATLPRVPLAGHSTASGHLRLGPTVRDVTDAALDLAGDARRIAFVATLPMGKVARWSAYERRPERAAFAGFFEPGPTAEETRVRFAAWIAALEADAIVLIDAAPGSRLTQLPAPAPWALGPALLREQTRFARVGERELSAYDTSVSAWRRVPRAPPLPAP